MFHCCFTSNHIVGILELSVDIIVFCCTCDKKQNKTKTKTKKQMTPALLILFFQTAHCEFDDVYKVQSMSVENSSSVMAEYTKTVKLIIYVNTWV